jgi:DNA polymerase-3 subunit alpha
MMHAIAKHTVEADYSSRYMPTEKEVNERFKIMHNMVPTKYIKTTKKLIDSVDLELDFKEVIPKYKKGISSKDELRKLAVKGLKERNKYLIKYRKQLKHEYEVVTSLGFEDYFLLCYDIVGYCRKNGIGVGPGRGSVCGSLLAYALRITDVDPIYLKTDFERFLRLDKKKLPDIDIDFCQTRRNEVIEYISNKYKNRVAQIATFGYYKTKNLANDLAKVYNMSADVLAKTKNLIEMMLIDNEE